MWGISVRRALWVSAVAVVAIAAVIVFVSITRAASELASLQAAVGDVKPAPSTVPADEAPRPATTEVPLSDTAIPDKGPIKVEVPIPGAASLEEAITLGLELDGEVISYLYGNEGLAGGFTPTPEWTSSDFLADFSDKYKTSPRVIALLTEFETIEQAEADSDKWHDRSATFDPPPVDTSYFDERIKELLGEDTE